MVCAFCPSVGVLTGAVTGYVSVALGLPTPKTFYGRVVSGIATAFASGITIFFINVVLKSSFGMSMCGGPAHSLLFRIGLISLQAIPLALIYGVAMNYLVSRFVEHSNQEVKVKPDESQQEQSRNCCCKRK